VDRQITVGAADLPLHRGERFKFVALPGACPRRASAKVLGLVIGVHGFSDCFFRSQAEPHQPTHGPAGKAPDCSISLFMGVSLARGELGGEVGPDAHRNPLIVENRFLNTSQRRFALKPAAVVGREGHGFNRLIPMDFRHNHYVPDWYQRRFMLPGQDTYWYLDLKPDPILHNGKVVAHRRDLLPWGPKKCFAEDDLYTTRWGTYENRDIEKFFFGRVDNEGKVGGEYFTDFDFDRPSQEPEPAFHGLMNYLSVQKLRTPKGLGWLSTLRGGKDHNGRLMLLQEIQQIYCAMWTECIWQIADATTSPTKFIISDHPITVYNRGCFPGSEFCLGFNDPDIRMAASHTYFPLSIDKVLILTNLSWVRNPYQKERNIRPNPNFFHNTIFRFTDIQTYRSLSEQEVLEINYITKKRALRYIAAADKEWLYPERHLRSTHWNKFGDGLLLMPEPREIHMGGEVYIGYGGGRSEAFGEYGHRPWQKGFKDEKRSAEESASLERFKAEWAARQGPAYRGTSYEMSHRRGGPYVTPDEFHQHDLERARQYNRRK